MVSIDLFLCFLVNTKLQIQLMENKEIINANVYTVHGVKELTN